MMAFTQLCSLEYTSVQQAVDLVKQLGRGAKLDLCSAYRMILLMTPPGDRMAGCNVLRSSSTFWSAFGPNFVHSSGWWSGLGSLSGYLFCSAPSSQEGVRALEVAVPLWDWPVAPSKVEGPSTSLTFCGIPIDSAKEVRLPQPKHT